MTLTNVYTCYLLVSIWDHVLCEESEYIGRQVHGEDTVVHKVVVIGEVWQAPWAIDLFTFYPQQSYNMDKGKQNWICEYIRHLQVCTYFIVFSLTRTNDLAWTLSHAHSLSTYLTTRLICFLYNSSIWQGFYQKSIRKYIMTSTSM